jgi:mannosylfructose-phosphate synthase
MFQRIAMLSTHGYFDPVPQLGQTDTGGQVVYVLELSKALRRLGVKVDIYTRWFDKNRKQIDPVPGFDDLNVIRIPAGPWQFIPKEQIYPVLPELAQNMIRFIEEQGWNYDLFHGHYVDAGIVTLDVAKHFGRPAFFTAHSLGAWKKERMADEGTPEELERKYNFSLRIKEETRIFRSVLAHTVTSEVQLQKLRELYDVPTDNVEVIPPGVDIYRFHPPKPDTPKPKGVPDNYIFCLSRIDTNKGHRELLLAFDLVRKEMDDVYLVIGGGSPNPGPREKEVLATIHEIINTHNLQDRVIMYGYVPDDQLPLLYQHSRFFVLPSKFEPFGMTSQEAMACGKTVVASKFGGVREVIKDGETGILIDPSDSRQFADAMLRLLRNPQMAEQIGRRARKLIEEHYSWDAVARRHLQFYEKWISKTSAN